MMNGKTPAPPAATPAAEDPGDLCVPLSSLAQPDPDNGDQMNPPAEGDSGTGQIDWKVKRIEGENAYIEITTVNGKPLDESDDAEPDEADQADQADQQERAQLGGMAGQMGAM